MNNAGKKRKADAGIQSPPPTPKRSATSLSLGDVALPNQSPLRKTTPLKGVPFREALEEVGGKGHGTVQLGASFPAIYKNEGKAKSLSVPINAVYQPKEQVRTTVSEAWTQGMMTGYGHSTVWAEILPKKMDVQSAQTYGRAIKSVMGNTVKDTNLGDFVAPQTRQAKRNGTVRTVKLTPSEKDRFNQSQASSAAHSFIGPAVTSFVEDLTGASAANTAYTGSAVRASFLRAKLLLKADPTRTDSPLVTKFDKHVREKLPQLNKDGAADLADAVSREFHKGTHGTADDYQKGVLRLHQDLDKTIDKTFTRKRKMVEAKWEKYGNQSLDVPTKKARIEQKAGKWWSEAVAQPNKLSHVDTPVEYADRKRSRYGVGKIPK